MNLEALGNLGDFIGSVAVVLSLIYVGFQLRQTPKVIRAQAAHARTELEFQLIQLRIQFPGNARKSNESWESMSFEEKRISFHMMTMHFTMYQNDFYQRDLGMIDPGLTQDVRKIRSLESPHFIEFWEQSKENYSDDFVSEIEKEIERRRAEHDN